MIYPRRVCVKLLLAVLYLFSWTEMQPLAKREVCNSLGCIRAASIILENIDMEVDPCTNFYKFACGNYIKSTHIPDDKGTVNVPHTIMDLLEGHLRRILEEPPLLNEATPFSLAKKLYRTCMDTESIETQSLDTLKNYLRDLGGWPVTEKNWNAEAFDWKQMTYRLHKIGFGSSYLLRMYIFLDPKNSSRTKLFFHQGFLGLRREYLSKGTANKLVDAYFSYMVDVAVMFGANKRKAVSELRESLEFEIQLANISLPKEELRNFTKLYNPITLVEMQARYPTIPWLQYVNSLLEEVKVGEDEVVILQAPDYMKKFERLMHETPKRVQANYMLWRVVENSANFLTNKLRMRLLQFMKVMNGALAMPPRWRECVAVVSNSLPISIGALYVRKFFDSASKAEAQQMEHNIRAELKSILTKNDWMDAETKERAVRKLASMQSHVGYPEELLDDALLSQYYGRLQVHEGRYLRSVLEITRFERVGQARSLHAPVNKSSWVDHANAAVVNAFYTFSENSINLPAGILQSVFFSNDRPRYLNYGSIGTVIGHEMIHGYDDKGRQYNEKGNLDEWWAPETEKAFVEKAQCFVDQYGNYTDALANLHLNGINTQGENIADNGGAKAAYQAYKRWASQRGTEPRLPGVPYTPVQTFWLSLASTFCTKSRPEHERLVVTEDEHSPAMFRVLGSLRNLDAFARDFECPPGSPMNPARKCRLW